TAVYQYTGGTTGRSKGAELTHRNIVTNAYQMQAVQDDGLVPDGANALAALPLYHIFAFTFTMVNGLLQGRHTIVVPSPRPPTNLKAVFEKYKITVFPAVNTLFAALLKEPWFTRDIARHMTLCVAGGTALQESVANTWREKFDIAIYQGYGLTESSCALTFMPQDRVKTNSIGVPLPDIGIQIVDDDGNEVPIGESGELIAKGPNIMKGYLNRPDETAETIQDGWLYTGDVAKMDEDGYLFIVDRKKDMILVSGFNVYPNELEDAIAHISGVAEVAVIGVPDEHSGEVPKAFIVRADEGLTGEDVLAHCKGCLTGYKRPREIEFVDEIPKSPVGKPLRMELRKMEMAKRENA
ncbi:MAG TPA: long-chain fatty acid--CoA ligase, partial [Rhodospirillales bacterium]|nr:long-chain fatty acid--CoA ligase [Rhodospirillales bacterium]